MDEILKRDQNHVTVIGGITDDSNQFIRMIRVDPITNRVLASATGFSTGTVTSVSVVSANGFAGTVGTATTTPAITLSTTNTSGSVLFAGTAGQLQQDNANFFWNDSNNFLGLITNAPTHTLTLGSTSTGIAVYNTVDQTTNYERVVSSWSGNTFNISSQNGGTGTARDISINTNSLNDGLTIRGNGRGATFTSNSGSGVAGGFFNSTGTFNGASTNQIVTGIAPTIAQTGTSNYTALLIDPFEQTVGSGTKLLIDAGTNTAANGSGTHTSVLTLNSTGTLSIPGSAGGNGRIILGTGTGINARFALGTDGLGTGSNFGTSGFGLQIAAATYSSTSSTGTIAVQGTHTFGIPTLAASNATTLTSASTVYIDGAPTASTNVTVANPYALYVNAGNAFFGGNITTSGTILTSNITSLGGSAAAEIQPTTTGTIISRNTADANSALIVNQSNASSTGAVLALQFNSASVGFFDTAGIYHSPGVSAASVNSAYVNTTVAGTIVSRNVADGNTALTVNQSNASSTGKIFDAQFNSASLFAIGKAGDIFLSTSAGTSGYVLTSAGAGAPVTWSPVSGASLTIGTTTIASGTTTRVLFDNAGVVGEYVISGTGNVAMTTSPAFTTPSLGVATATSINGNIFTTGTYTLTGQAGKTLTFNGSITLTGTDAQTYTFPTTSATLARTDAANTFIGASTATSWVFTTPLLGTPTSGVLTNCTGLPAASVVAGTFGTGAYTMDTKLTVPQVINTANAITASGNAATVPVTQKHNIVTNNSAATLTVTLTTASAVNMQMVVVQILDFSAVAQTITWVNTENSTVTAPTTSNGSTTLPLTVGFIYNSATSKWRCIASA